MTLSADKMTIGRIQEITDIESLLTDGQTVVVTTFEGKTLEAKWDKENRMAWHQETSTAYGFFDVPSANTLELTLCYRQAEEIVPSGHPKLDQLNEMLEAGTPLRSCLDLHDSPESSSMP